MAVLGATESGAVAPDAPTPARTAEGVAVTSATMGTPVLNPTKKGGRKMSLKRHMLCASMRKMVGFQ